MSGAGRRPQLATEWSHGFNNVFNLRSDQGNNLTWLRFTDPRQYITTLSVDW